MPIYVQSPAVSVIASSQTGSVQTMVTVALIFVPEAFAAARAEAVLARTRKSVAVVTAGETEPVVETAEASNQMESHYMYDSNLT